LNVVKLVVDPERPHPRHIQQVVTAMQSGGVGCYPTDTVYGLGRDLYEQQPTARRYNIKGKSTDKPPSQLSEDRKVISQYAVVGDNAYRLMRRILPGPYTVILRASRLVPKVMLNKRKTVGIRVPDHPVPQMLVETLGNPMINTSVPLEPGETYNDPNLIDDR